VTCRRMVAVIVVIVAAKGRMHVDAAFPIVWLVVAHGPHIAEIPIDDSRAAAARNRPLASAGRNRRIGRVFMAPEAVWAPPLGLRRHVRPARSARQRCRR